MLYSQKIKTHNMQISDTNSKSLNKHTEIDQLLKQKTLEIAVRMLKEKLPDSLIIQTTALSNDEIKKIKHQM